MKETPRGCEASNHTRGHRIDAPIAFRVEREGETVAICTACLREDDTIVELVASFEMNGRHYQEHDEAGFILLSIMLLTHESGNRGPIM